MHNATKLAEKQISSVENKTVNTEACAPSLAFYVIMGMAVLLGAWGAICLTNGLITASTLQEVGRGLAMAITGI